MSMGVIFFGDDFDVDTSANWTVNKSNPTGSSAVFSYNYGTLAGIPSAPNSIGGTTKGLRLDANTFGTGVFSGLSASPNAQSFIGDYRLHFDAWLNFIGPAPVGGSGSTQAGGAGIGTAGATAQWAGSAVQDSIHFSTTTDGNSSVDWRAYSSAAPTGYLAPSGVFAAGTGTSPDARNNSHPYYAGFGGATPPAAQTALFPSQTGATLVGSIGFGWHDFKIDKVGNLVSWYVDNLNIANVDASTVTLGGTNILLNYFDTNTNSSSSQAASDQNYMIFDNVRIENVPEPTSLVLLALAGLPAAALRRRRSAAI